MNMEDEMHPEIISQIAAQRSAELHQRGDEERMLRELRAGRAARPGRRWLWARPGLRHAGRAAA